MSEINAYTDATSFELGGDVELKGLNLDWSDSEIAAPEDFDLESSGSADLDLPENFDPSDGSYDVDLDGGGNARYTPSGTDGGAPFLEVTEWPEPTVGVDAKGNPLEQYVVGYEDPNGVRHEQSLELSYDYSGDSEEVGATVTTTAWVPEGLVDAENGETVLVGGLNIDGEKDGRLTLVDARDGERREDGSYLVETAVFETRLDGDPGGDRDTVLTELFGREDSDYDQGYIGGAGSLLGSVRVKTDENGDVPMDYSDTVSPYPEEDAIVNEGAFRLGWDDPRPEPLDPEQQLLKPLKGFGTAIEASPLGDVGRFFRNGSP